MVALAFLFLLSGAACGEQGQKEFRIGLVAPITGPISKAGQSSVNAANMLVDEFNAGGGLEIAGEKYKVVLFIEDNEFNPDVSAAKVLTLINQHEVAAIVGPVASSNAIAAGVVAERFKVPMIAPASTNPETTRNKKWVFRAAFLDPFQSAALAEFSQQQLGATKVAVLFDITSDYNKGLAETYKSSFEGLGGEVVAYESYTPDALDVSDQMTRIKDSEPDILFLPNYYSEVPEQVSQARAVGIDAQILGADAWTLLGKFDRDGLNGAYFTSHYDPSATDELPREFAARYERTFGEEYIDVAALTADAFGLLFEAARSQGMISPEAIREGMGAIDNYQGITGSFSYDGVTGDPVKSVILLKISNGEFVFHSRIDP